MVLLTGSCSSNTEAEKPNIIFILADDLGFDLFYGFPNGWVDYFD